jgi:hypothetical protein
MTRHSSLDGTGVWNLTELPGCDQVVVSHGVFTKIPERGKGKGGVHHKERLAMIKQLGFDMALCTVNMENAPERKILESHGWLWLTSFTSSKTGNVVGLYCRSGSDGRD